MVKLDIHAVAVLNYETGLNFGAYRRRKQLLVFQDVCDNLASPRCEISAVRNGDRTQISIRK